jgi:hypothetical protein
MNNNTPFVLCRVSSIFGEIVILLNLLYTTARYIYIYIYIYIYRERERETYYPFTHLSLISIKFNDIFMTHNIRSRMLVEFGDVIPMFSENNNVY